MVVEGGEGVKLVMSVMVHRPCGSQAAVKNCGTYRQLSMRIHVHECDAKFSDNVVDDSHEKVQHFCQDDCISRQTAVAIKCK